MAYENELIEILQEGYGKDWNSKKISEEEINHLAQILEQKLNLLVQNIDSEEYFKRESEIHNKYYNI